jgi:hypothetical protein
MRNFEEENMAYKARTGVEQEPQEEENVFNRYKPDTEQTTRMAKFGEWDPAVQSWNKVRRIPPEETASSIR